MQEMQTNIREIQANMLGNRTNSHSIGIAGVKMLYSQSDEICSAQISEEVFIGGGYFYALLTRVQNKLY